jgi:hypothetical protein
MGWAKESTMTELKQTISEIIIRKEEIHFTIRRTSSALTTAEEFQFYCEWVEGDAKRLVEVLKPFMAQHEATTYTPVLNGRGNVLVFRCDGVVRFLCNPIGENKTANFTEAGTWVKVRNAIRKFDSKIQIVKK